MFKQDKASVINHPFSPLDTEQTEEYRKAETGNQKEKYFSCWLLLFFIR